jgi:hypothetical protein
MVSAAPAGASAENFAISPDGRTIVTLNMENSFLTPGDERLTFYSSLTLMDWDPEREVLTTKILTRSKASCLRASASTVRGGSSQSPISRTPIPSARSAKRLSISGG